MVRPESIEEHLRESETRRILKRNINSELAVELDEEGILIQVLKKRIYTEMIDKIYRTKNDNNSKNERIAEVANEWFGVEIDRRYLEKKDSYEKVCFRLFRNKNKGIALEMYQRLSNKEQSWESISEDWGERPEKRYGGKYTPTLAKRLSKELRNILIRLQPGQLSEPELIGKYYTVAELIEWERIELSEGMRKELEREMLDEWVASRSEELKEEIIKETD
tara:strand:+ start:3304 stop:3966 length:663 start_codon:yes stop_codon:yes gene_type:complete